MCGTTATKGRVVLSDAQALLCSPCNVFCGQVAFAATLCLLVVSLICWCRFAPFSGCQCSRFISEQVRCCSHPQQHPAQCALSARDSGYGSSITLKQHSHCTLCLCTALAGNCQQHAGYPHKAGRVPSLVLFRCLLRGLLSKMALTSDPAADGVTVALADCHSHPVSSLTFSFLYNVGNPPPSF